MSADSGRALHNDEHDTSKLVSALHERFCGPHFARSQCLEFKPLANEYRGDFL